MSEHPSRKRAAEYQLNSTDFDENGEPLQCDERTNETFVTEPQLAPPEEMRERRTVRVRRPDAAPEAPTGLFKNLATTAPAKTGFDAKNPFGVSSATAVKPAFGNSSFSFSFGNTNTTAAASASGKTETPSTDAKPAFSFNIPTAGANSFSFGFAAPSATADDAKTAKPATASTTTPTVSKDGADAKEDASEPKKLFGSSAAFSFSSAVGTFVEARKKMEDAQPAKESADPAEATSADNTTGDNVEPTGSGAAALAEVSTKSDLDTVLRAPVKLFLWKKDDDKPHWAETGAGDARIVKELCPSPEDPEKETVIHRLLVRDGYSLNVLISKGHLDMGTVNEKRLTVTVLTPEAISTYAMRFSGATGAENAKQFGDKLTELLK